MTSMPDPFGLDQARWLKARRRELAKEWAAMPLADIQVGIREAQDVAREIGVPLRGTKKQLLREIRKQAARI